MGILVIGWINEIQTKFHSKIKVNASGKKNFHTLLDEANLTKCPSSSFFFYYSQLLGRAHCKKEGLQSLKCHMESWSHLRSLGTITEIGRKRGGGGHIHIHFLISDKINYFHILTKCYLEELGKCRQTRVCIQTWRHSGAMNVDPLHCT